MNWQISEGDIVAGKYRVEKRLGEGGMGAVLAARHLELGQRVALKVMHSELAENAQAVTRFTREGQAAVRLRSAHVARVLDVGRLESGVPYLVMEYLEGKDLSSVISSGGPLPLADAVDYLLQACEAVAEAHAAGIVHRDLKPANLFLTTDPYGQPTIKVLDFGISKLSQEMPGTPGTSGSLTATSAIMGSPLYMPPEQMRSTRDADARSDIWALGVILYELLTANPVWPGDTLSEICVRVATDPTPSVHAKRPDIPDGVDVVIGRCLEKDPKRRYQQVAELASALLPYASAEGQSIVQRVYRLSGANARQAEAQPATATAANPATGALQAQGAVSALKEFGSAFAAPGTGVAWGSRTGASQVGASRNAKLAVGVAAVVIVAALSGVVYITTRSSAAPRVPASASADVVPVAASPVPVPSAAVPAASASTLPIAVAGAVPSASASASTAAVPVPDTARAHQPSSRATVAAARSTGGTSSPKSKSVPPQSTTLTPDWGGRQ